jgi:hypothetical protein
MIKEQIKTLLTQEMTRKNFLQYSGGLILAVVGITGFMRVLLGGAKGFSQNYEVQTSGYGSSSYGE